MHPIRKIIHRGFNAVMRLMIPLFPYREPKILDDIGGVLNVLTEGGIKRVLLIAGKTVRGTGLTAPLEKLLSDSGIEIIFVQFECFHIFDLLLRCSCFYTHIIHLF